MYCDIEIEDIVLSAALPDGESVSAGVCVWVCVYSLSLCVVSMFQVRYIEKKLLKCQVQELSPKRWELGVCVCVLLCASISVLHCDAFPVVVRGRVERYLENQQRRKSKSRQVTITSSHDVSVYAHNIGSNGSTIAWNIKTNIAMNCSYIYHHHTHMKFIQEN